MVNTEQAKVLAICIDSMSLDYIRPHLDRLPAFRRLIETGAYSDLATSADPLTASIWASFATGDNPGVHGHYYPFQWDPDAMCFDRVARRAWWKRLGYEPFWHDLARKGVAAVAFDPGTTHAGEAPLTEIVNWAYQSTGAASASDPALLAEIRRRFGRRPIGKEVPVPKTLAHSRRMRDDLIASIEAKAAATLWLMERKADWRFFLVGFYEVHRAGHNLLVVDGDYGSEADPDALLAVYEAQDRALARLMEKAEGAGVTIILFSLHGMVPNWSQEHFADRIMARLNDAWAVSRGDTPAPEKAPNLMSRLRAAIPHRVQFTLAYLLGEHVQDWVVNRSIIGGVDWKRTPAFRLASGGEGYIRLNIKGRERDGCLEPGEVADYVAWLKARLSEIKVAAPAAGAPLVREVREVKSVFDGPRADFLPDLVIAYAPAEPATAIESPAIGRLEAHLGTGRGGNHAPHAFMIVAGPGRNAPARAAVKDIRDMRAFIETLLLDTRHATPERAAALADA
jgi:predicted AlkP superfamily phosphohydrolase/phosphomutase